MSAPERVAEVMCNDAAREVRQRPHLEIGSHSPYLKGDGQVKAALAEIEGARVEESQSKVQSSGSEGRARRQVYRRCVGIGVARAGQELSSKVGGTRDEDELVGSKRPLRLFFLGIGHGREQQH